MRRGLVIGKFYPPHAGHAFLIDSAASACDSLDILICHKPEQQISGNLRARWLRELHPGASVRLVDDIVPDDDSEGWARYTIQLLGYAPDVVFTSEEYGDRYARFLGAQHVSVDPARMRIAISATKIRGDPYEHRGMLAPCVRAYFVKRAVLIGAESTGKTTLCRQLAAHFNAPWVEEYGREYTLSKYGDTMQTSDWTGAEFVHIAREQQRREDAAARRADRLLLADTDAFATEIWYERYRGDRPPSRGWPSREPKAALYLIPEPDVAFVQDGIRDGEHLRTWMHARFLEECAARQLPHRILTGSYAARERQAIEALTELLEAPHVPF